MLHIFRSIFWVCFTFGVAYPVIAIIYYKVKSKGKETIKSIFERIGF